MENNLRSFSIIMFLSDLFAFAVQSDAYVNGVGIVQQFSLFYLSAAEV